MIDQTTICLEGMVGSGKTLQMKLLHSYLSPDSFLIPELNEFLPVQEAIKRWKKRLKKERKLYGFEKEDIIDLAQARAQVQKDLLEKARDKEYILMERGVYTSVVFESGSVSMEEILKINKDKGVIIPQKCVVLYCPPTEALKRVDERRARVGIYSHRAIHENEEFISRTRRLYRELAQSNNSMYLVDSFRDPEQIFSDILEVLKL